MVPALAKAVTPVSTYLGYKVMPRHIHEILLAALIYHAIFLASSKLGPRLCRDYSALPERTRINFDIHVVSMVQCTLILALALPLFRDRNLTDHVYGYTPYSGFVSAMAVGYFLWDSLVCIWYVRYFGIGFAVHGVVAGFVFLQGMRPMILHYCPHFLLFELSTPFLNINWFATHLPSSPVPFALRLANGLCLMATFFLVRIVWGFYMAPFVFRDLFMRFNNRTHPQWVAVTIVLSNLVLNSLNVYWFYKMQQVARRAISDKPESITKEEKKQS